MKSMISESISFQQSEQMKNDHAFLSKFTKKLSAVKNRRQLFNTINRDLGSYLNFEYFTIFILNTDRDAVFNYFSNETLADPDDPFYKCTIFKLSELRSLIAGSDHAYKNPVDFDEIYEQQLIDVYFDSPITD